VPACVTPVEDGMAIELPDPGERLLRRVSGFQPHPDYIDELVEAGLTDLEE